LGAPGVGTGYGDRYGAYGTHYAGYDGLYGGYGYGGWGGAAYPYYSPAMYASYPGAWPMTGVGNSSLYANPGYGSTANQVGLAATPAPYDYGSNVVVQPDNVYVNGDSVGTPQQFEDQAKQLAATGQAAQADPNGKWLPIGVFAIAKEGETSSDHVFQIAVNPDGIIRGNYNTISSKKVEPIAGAVDKTSQRAAWTIGKDQFPVYDAGIANLTKDSTPILVHSGSGQSHQLTLVRLQPPTKDSSADGGDAGARP
jgi:hypothetical protein